MSILIRMVNLNLFDQYLIEMAGSSAKHPNHQVIKGYDTVVKISKVRSSREANSWKMWKAPGYGMLWELFFFSSTWYVEDHRLTVALYSSHPKQAANK